MSARPRILVVDDEPAVLRALSVALESQGHEVIAAATGTQAVAKAAADGPDLILLDLGLPDADGLEVIRRVRAFAPSVPVIVVSAYGEDRAKVDALDLGADDYVVKPFAMPELLARVRAGLRRGAAAAGAAGERVAEHSELRVDPASRRAWARGTEVHLTPTQFNVLLVLVRNTGRVLSHRMIVREAWGSPGAADSANLRVVVGQLRRAVEADPRRPRLIVTLPGVGYRLDDPAAG
ncbi:MAG: response regulator transcription factor [Thermoleophilia bacterium]|nr:response regulator transcription factor [Thermoleophilia bacterium]